MRKNKLENETSAYLIAHATNPVDWYPWGKEAIEKARQENKPILLSIGYMACHWCHVMAHESFENIETANLMNRLFINVKVDKEERPDLDKIYQVIHSIVTGRSGGWPLTAFLSPHDLVPFFVGTYFPLSRQFQLPSFKEVLFSMNDIYSRYQEDIETHNKKLISYLQSLRSSTGFFEGWSDLPIKTAVKSLEKEYDFLYGGFGQMVKFPQPMKLFFLFSYKPAIVYQTLLHMALGGIYDHLQGGFFRYSVDRAWMIPHFEKMLYDNAQLLDIYSVASYFFNSQLFREIAKETAKWLIHEMQDENGAYCSSLKADTEGVEGKFYTWSREEIKNILNEPEYHLIQSYYHVDDPPNFQGEWHLYAEETLEDTRKKLNASIEETEKLLKSAKNKLLNARGFREKPLRDTKIITSWNALTIKALVIASKVHGDQSYVDAAESALVFIKNNLWKENKLYSSYPYKSTLPGFIDDYAFLLEAILIFLEVKWSNEYFYFAISLAEQLIEQFYDKKFGGFFFTSHYHEEVIYRPKFLIDEAMPSSSGVASHALLKLGYLSQEERYIHIAEGALRYAWPFLLKYPEECGSFLILLKELMNPLEYIILTGKEAEVLNWQQECQKVNPLVRVYAIPFSRTLPKFLSKKISNAHTYAHIFVGKSSRRMVNNLNDLIAWVKQY